MDAHVRTPPPVSVVLDQLLATEQHITVGEVVDRVAERGFGLLMMVLGLPMLIPVLPPGASTIVGPIYSLLSIQLVVGLERPWLPARLRRRTLSPRTVGSLRQRGIPLVRRLERFSRPRFHILHHPVMVRVAALVVFAMGLILLSPAPFLNTLPALAVMLIGIGLLNDDGYFVLAGTVLGIVLVGAFVAAIGLIVQVLKRLLPWWFD